MQADPGSARQLFPPPETVDGDQTWIVEGEPDAVAGATLGLPTVAIPGTNGWRSEWAERFAGRRVVIVPDCDQRGRELATRVAGNLAAHAADVRVVDLDPSRVDGYDLGDLLKEAGEDGRGELRGVLERMAEEEEPVKPPGRRLVARAASTIEPEATRWLWGGRVQLGGVTLLAGRQGLGKSTLACELAAQLSRGKLDGDLDGAAGALIVSYEDHAERTIAPRLAVAGADLGRVHLLAAEHDGLPDLVSLPGDLDAIGTAAREHGARLLVVDPLVASLASGEVNAHRDQDVRRAMAPLAKLAEEADLAVVCTIHFNKAAGSDALARVSVGFGARPRLRVREQYVRGERRRLKSRSARRDIPLSPAMAKRLWALSARSRDDAPMFPSATGTPLHPSNLRNRVLAPAVKRAGLEWAGFHTLRHTCASLLFDAGRNVKQVQQWLGHATPSFTLDTYVHLLDESLGDAGFSMAWWATWRQRKIRKPPQARRRSGPPIRLPRAAPATLRNGGMELIMERSVVRFHPELWPCRAKSGCSATGCLPRGVHLIRTTVHTREPATKARPTNRIRRMTATFSFARSATCREGTLAQKGIAALARKRRAGGDHGHDLPGTPPLSHLAKLGRLSDPAF